jgi:hypothetical protein
MRILGKNGVLYIILALLISIFVPIVILVILPFIWMYSKITGRKI